MNEAQKRFERRVKLEEKLNSLDFDGMPVGNLLAYQLTQRIQRPDNRKPNKLLKWKLLFNFFTPYAIKLPEGKLWLSPTDVSQRCVGLFLELARILQSGVLLFLLPVRNQPFVHLPRKPRLSFQLWRKWIRHYRLIKKDFDRIIKSNWPETSNDSELLFKIQLDLIIQTQMAVMIGEIIGNSRPLLILVDYDRSPFNSVLVTAANKYGIKTQTLIHGSTNPIHGYVPVLARECSCWGSLQMEQFKRAGVEADRLNIVGNPKFNRNRRLDKAEIKKKLNIKENINLAVFGNNRLPGGRHIGILKDFIEAYQPWSDSWMPVIRLHPVEQYSDYAGLLDDSCRFLLLKDQCSLEETLEAADLLFIHNSNVSQDAMLYDVPVVVYNPTDIDAGIGEILRKQADTPYLTNKPDLQHFLAGFNKPGAEKQVFIERQSAFFKEYCRYIGHESALAIVRTFGPQFTEWLKPEFRQSSWSAAS